MRKLNHPPPGAFSLPRVLRALSDPIRLRIVAVAAGACEQGESCAGFGIDLPKATLSHHFKVLRDAGVIMTRCEGTRCMTTLRRAELEARFPGLIASVLGAVGSAGDRKTRGGRVTRGPGRPGKVARARAQAR